MDTKINGKPSSSATIQDQGPSVRGRIDGQEEPYHKKIFSTKKYDPQIYEFGVRQTHGGRIVPGGWLTKFDKEIRASG